MNQIDLKSKTIKILKGSSIAVVISAICFICFAVVLTQTDVKESIIPYVIIIISFVSIIIGSFISSIKLKKNGIINGALVGFIYISFIYLLSSIILTGFRLNMSSTIMICGSIISGMIGGIIGVNIK